MRKNEQAIVYNFLKPFRDDHGIMQVDDILLDSNQL